MTESTESTREKKHDCEACRLRTKVKSMRSGLVIGLGLIIGLLFVDVAQLFTERGLSARALGDAQVVEYDGATWVKYTEPHVRAYFFTDPSCTEICDDVKILLSELKYDIPTMSVQHVDLSTPEGRAFAEERDVTDAPHVLVDKNLRRTEFFLRADPLFDPASNGFYSLKLSLFLDGQTMLEITSDQSDT